MEFVSCGYNGGNKNKETFVLKRRRRPCDAISKDTTVKKGQRLGFGHKNVFTLMSLAGNFVHLLDKTSDDTMLLVIL